MKKQRLSNDEIDIAIEKIRTTYQENAETYGENYFNVDKFNERYFSALRERIPIEMFIMAERQAIDDVIKKIEQDKERQRILSEGKVMQKVDQIIDEHRQRIAHYPEVDFHPDADEELRHLYGALQQFYWDYWTHVRPLFPPMKDYIALKVINKFTDELHSFVMSMHDKLPYRFDQFAIACNRKNSSAAIEIAHRELIKETAFLLNEIYDWMQKTELPNSDDIYEPKEYEAAPSSFTGMVKADVFMNIKNKLGEIIYAFRLDDLRRRESK